MPLKYKDGSCVCTKKSKVEDLEKVIYLRFGDSNVIDTLGSDDATTCHIAVLRHSGSGATGLCHFDSCGTSQGVGDLVDRVSALSQDVDGRLELHIVGGFKDDDGSSEELSRKLLSEFHKLPVDVYLLTACISGLNNIVKNGVNHPILYGVGVSVKTGEIFPATFAYKGPDKQVRGLRHFIGDEKVINIYNHTDHRLRISPYSYRHTDFPHAAFFLQQSDQTIRQYLSTSPDVEPQHFAQQVKAAIAFFLSHPSSELVFPGGESRYFRMGQDGLWLPDKG
ncbi:protein N-terminal asparagine amidohydrolase-like isoform X2 [Patiria miniata]|uniref:Protein N-terminal asparagine amidohydrolase n=1 Tax=Patiria miniata TaxID=46514 RepID=A0A914A6E5_PATMI|nr:protein N-terminal asparagine amidohydrolase-like isoform X2 [Patiria miniata]